MKSAAFTSGALLIAISLCRRQVSPHAESTEKDIDGQIVEERNPYAAEADLAVGRKLFARRCAQCHGTNGEGWSRSQPHHRAISPGRLGPPTFSHAAQRHSRFGDARVQI